MIVREQNYYSDLGLKAFDILMELPKAGEERYKLLTGASAGFDKIDIEILRQSLLKLSDTIRALGQ
ncbi:MAG: hypothetical protein [Mu-like cryoconite phage AB09]|nr:MAG: hypothetical protein [Mu-like cryoconite phage AB09]